ncbi:MAG: transposase [Pirellula sp.]|nr:transposase [Pirellula sp.]
MLQLAQSDGFINGDEVAIDGTYIEALASRQRIVNQATLAKRIQVLEQVISGATDNAQGTGKPNAKSKWMAQTDTGKAEQLDRYQRSRQEIEKRLKKNRERKPSTQLDESKIFVGTSDPAVPISRNKLAVFGPLWPTQFVTHVQSNLILAVCVFTIPSDSNTIGSMIDLARSNGAINIRTAYADSGYSSLSDIRSCHERSIRLVAPVGENSFTEQKKQAKITVSGKQPKTTKDAFVFDYDKLRCTCPNGITMDATKDGKRTLLNGDVLQCYRINFTPEICKGCPLIARCKDGEKSTRAVKLIEGEEMLVAHKKAMTPNVLSNCRTIRAQTAEKAFGDGKERVGLRKLGGRTPARTNAITILHGLRHERQKALSTTPNQQKAD